MRRRAKVWLIVGLVVVVFVIVGGALARVFSADSAERSAITTLLQDEARGDTAAVIADITRCNESAACRARAATNAAALKGPGAISILLLEESTGSFTVSTTKGVSRVAWRKGSGLPIVQCVLVRRSGNPITGIHIELLTVSKRIRSDTACPAKL
jgi:hypothetical protein